MNPFTCRACSKESRATWIKIDVRQAYLVCEHCLFEHTLRQAYGLPSASPDIGRPIPPQSSVGEGDPH